MLREAMNKWAASLRPYEVVFVLQVKGILEGWGHLKSLCVSKSVNAAYHAMHLLYLRASGGLLILSPSRLPQTNPSSVPVSFELRFLGGFAKVSL